MPFLPGAVQNRMTIVKFSELHDHARIHTRGIKLYIRPLKCHSGDVGNAVVAGFRLQNFHGGNS